MLIYLDVYWSSVFRILTKSQFLSLDHTTTIILDATEIFATFRSSPYPILIASTNLQKILSNEHQTFLLDNSFKLYFHLILVEDFNISLFYSFSLNLKSNETSTSPYPKGLFFFFRMFFFFFLFIYVSLSWSQANQAIYLIQFQEQTVFG